jgi:ABC-type nickel/cobalt efflux system permease component RcnA
MEWMGRSDVILLAIGAYVALVRLMRRRRDELVADVQRQMEAHRHHRKKRQNHNDHENRGAA